jgi:catechol 2,3-dioxygenase-like lactoylglutathione lyase family enzyme
MLHVVLGLIFLIEGTLILIHAFSQHEGVHLLAFGAVELIAAVLFIWPRTIRIGACGLVCAFIAAAVFHVAEGEFPSEHLVGAVAVLFVTLHRSDSRSGPERAARVTSLAPQFLVDDLARSIAYYQKFGFTFGEPWDGFYAIGLLDGLELHLKEAPKNDDEHLDAAAGVDGIEAFYAQCTANGATIIKPLTATPWGTKDFYVEDPDGHIVSFGGRPAATE